MSEEFPDLLSLRKDAHWLSLTGRLLLPECPLQNALIACSGGADSVFLSCLLTAALPPETSKSLLLAHVHHGLRGEEADRDAACVESLAVALGLAFRLLTIPPLTSGEISEDLLRQHRFHALEALLLETGGEVIFLGHQKNDIAENLLMGLGRGYGISGLASPRAVQPMHYSAAHAASGTYIRSHPLLDFTRPEIEAALRAFRIHWVEDSSNRGLAYARNRLRHQVVPRWQAALPQEIMENIAASRQYMEEADAALDQWLDQLNPDLSQPEFLSGEVLRGFPTEIWRRAFLRWTSQHHLPESIRRKVLDKFIRQWMSGESAIWEKGDLRIRAEHYCLAREEDSATVQWPAVHWEASSQLFLPGGTRLAAQRIDGLQALDKIRRGGVACDREALIDFSTSRFLVSRWEPGDRMTPLGAPGSRKLQDLFTDRKIPQPLRQQLPVLRDPETGEILWVPGIPPADSRKVEKTRRKVLWLKFGTALKDRDNYELSRRVALENLNSPLSLGGQPLPREELHNRVVPRNSPTKLT